MPFNSLTYLLFLFIFVFLYWIVPQRGKLWLIFLSSISFYSFWKIEFTPLLLFSTITDYLIARAIYQATTPIKRKALLTTSLLINLGLLFYFKYLLFFTETLRLTGNLFGIEITPINLDLILPLGISFYTFQTISYSIDVYRQIIKPERYFIRYACFVTFFPQLVAGPILRANEMLPQFGKFQNFCLKNFAEGISRIIQGVFLKVVLADNIAPMVDAGFSIPASQLSALDIWTLAFLFGFQIYFDFSAYSHIAIGSAKLLGIHLLENFNFPYLAHSLRDFWGRWHISLSSWVRDYLYLPLAKVPITGLLSNQSSGGLEEEVQKNRRGDKTRALFITWGLMGLWHGASWTFVFWGLYHAIFIFLYRILASVLGPAKNFLPTPLRNLMGWILTCSIIMLGWIPFRASSLQQTYDMFSRLIVWEEYFWLGLPTNAYLSATIMFIGILACPFMATRGLTWIRQKPAYIRIPIESIAFAILIGLDVIFFQHIQQFIYFQF